MQPSGVRQAARSGPPQAGTAPVTLRQATSRRTGAHVPTHQRPGSSSIRQGLRCSCSAVQAAQAAEANAGNRQSLQIDSQLPGAVIINFIVSAAYEQGVRIVGNLPALGSWNPDQGVVLFKVSKQLWSGACVLPDDYQGCIEYKAVHVPEDGSTPLWEDGQNRKLQTTAWHPAYNLSTETTTIDNHDAVMVGADWIAGIRNAAFGTVLDVSSSWGEDGVAVKLFRAAARPAEDAYLDRNVSGINSLDEEHLTPLPTPPNITNVTSDVAVGTTQPAGPPMAGMPQPSGPPPLPGAGLPQAAPAVANLAQQQVPGRPPAAPGPAPTGNPLQPGGPVAKPGPAKPDQASLNRPPSGHPKPGDPVPCRIILLLGSELPAGQEYKLVGSVPQLGDWDVTKGLAMTSQGSWVVSAETKLPCETDVEFKIVTSKPGEEAVWEGGPNRTMHVPSPPEDAGPGRIALLMHCTNPAAVHSVFEQACQGELAPFKPTLPTTCLFTVPHYPLAPGQELVLVGSLPQLGDWKPEDGLVLAAAGQACWQGTVDGVPLGATAEAKLVVRDSTGVHWEPGVNRSIVIAGSTDAISSHATGATSYLVLLPDAASAIPTVVFPVYLEESAMQGRPAGTPARSQNGQGSVPQRQPPSKGPPQVPGAPWQTNGQSGPYNPAANGYKQPAQPYGNGHKPQVPQYGQPQYLNRTATGSPGDVATQDAAPRDETTPFKVLTNLEGRLAKLKANLLSAAEGQWGGSAVQIQEETERETVVQQPEHQHQQEPERLPDVDEQQQEEEAGVQVPGARAAPQGQEEQPWSPLSVWENLQDDNADAKPAKSADEAPQAWSPFAVFDDTQESMASSIKSEEPTARDEPALPAWSPFGDSTGGDHGFSWNNNYDQNDNETNEIHTNMATSGNAWSPLSDFSSDDEEHVDNRYNTYDNYGSNSRSSSNLGAVDFHTVSYDDSDFLPAPATTDRFWNDDPNMVDSGVVIDAGLQEELADRLWSSLSRRPDGEGKHCDEALAAALAAAEYVPNIQDDDSTTIRLRFDEPTTQEDMLPPAWSPFSDGVVSKPAHDYATAADVEEKPAAVGWSPFADWASDSANEQPTYSSYAGIEAPEPASTNDADSFWARYDAQVTNDNHVEEPTTAETAWSPFADSNVSNNSYSDSYGYAPFAEPSISYEDNSYLAFNEQNGHHAESNGHVDEDHHVGNNGYSGYSPFGSENESSSYSPLSSASDHADSNSYAPFANTNDYAESNSYSPFGNANDHAESYSYSPFGNSNDHADSNSYAPFGYAQEETYASYPEATLPVVNNDVEEPNWSTDFSKWLNYGQDSQESTNTQAEQSFSFDTSYAPANDNAFSSYTATDYSAPTESWSYSYLDRPVAEPIEQETVKPVAQQPEETVAPWSPLSSFLVEEKQEKQEKQNISVPVTSVSINTPPPVVAPQPVVAPPKPPATTEKAPVERVPVPAVVATVAAPEAKEPEAQQPQEQKAVKGKSSPRKSPSKSPRPRLNLPEDIAPFEPRVIGILAAVPPKTLDEMHEVLLHSKMPPKYNLAKDRLAVLMTALDTQGVVKVDEQGNFRLRDIEVPPTPTATRRRASKTPSAERDGEAPKRTRRKTPPAERGDATEGKKSRTRRVKPSNEDKTPSLSRTVEAAAAHDAQQAVVVPAAASLHSNSSNGNGATGNHAFKDIRSHALVDLEPETTTSQKHA